jgi:hypothetical protein
MINYYLKDIFENYEVVIKNKFKIDNIIPIFKLTDFIKYNYNSKILNIKKDLSKINKDLFIIKNTFNQKYYIGLKERVDTDGYVLPINVLLTLTKINKKEKNKIELDRIDYTYKEYINDIKLIFSLSNIDKIVENIINDFKKDNYKIIYLNENSLITNLEEKNINLKLRKFKCELYLQKGVLITNEKNSYVLKFSPTLKYTYFY